MTSRAGRLDPASRKLLMARFRSSNTHPELVLRQCLRRAGLTGYRLHCRHLPGRPDVAYTRWRVAVFVDGAFWHGHPSAFVEGTKGEYWDKKISRNRERDARVTAALESLGWTVVRIWDFEVLKDAQLAIAAVERALEARGRPAAGS